MPAILCVDLPVPGIWRHPAVLLYGIMVFQVTSAQSALLGVIAGIQYALLHVQLP